MKDMNYEFISNQRQNTVDSKSYIKNKYMHGKKYLDFVLNPDKEEPRRMPSDYTFPTNIVSVDENFAIQIDTAGDFYGFFAPQNQLRCNNSYAGYQPYSTASTACASYAPWVFFSRATTTPVPLVDEFTSYMTEVSGLVVISNRLTKNQGRNAFPYSGQFNAARCIGAVCQTSYIGNLEATSGNMHIGAQVLPANGQSAGDLKPPTIAQLQNLLAYKKYLLSAPTRVIWFPVDASAQNFQNADPVSTPPGAQKANFSQLVFLYNGTKIPVGSTIDITIKMYYEVVPNLQFSSLFSLTQGVCCESKKDAWTEISELQRNGIHDLLISSNT